MTKTRRIVLLAFVLALVSAPAFAQGGGASSTGSISGEIKDAQGVSLVTVPDLFLKAASVGEDTRLKPKESRTERFTVPVSADARAIVVRLEYRDASDPKAGPQTTLVTEERHQLPGR